MVKNIETDSMVVDAAAHALKHELRNSRDVEHFVSSYMDLEGGEYLELGISREVIEASAEEAWENDMANEYPDGDDFYFDGSDDRDIW